MSDSAPAQEVGDVAAEGRYLYCVVEFGRKKVFRKLGIDGEDVYTIPYKGISAVVHRSPPKPYQSDDRETAKGWLLKHQEVVNFFFEKYDATLPLAFDTIVKGRGTDVDEKVRGWLREEYSNLRRKMDTVRGKQEFGVQIFWESKPVINDVMNESAEAKKLLNEIESKPRGLAYMLEQKLKDVIKREIEEKAKRLSNELYNGIRSRVEDMRMEKILSPDGDRQMIMNVSCLVPKEGVAELGRELDRVNSVPHISVKFTGPWPPYSFVA